MMIKMVLMSVAFSSKTMGLSRDEVNPESIIMSQKKPLQSTVSQDRYFAAPLELTYWISGDEKRLER